VSVEFLHDLVLSFNAVEVRAANDVLDAAPLGVPAVAILRSRRLSLRFHHVDRLHLPLVLILEPATEVRRTKIDALLHELESIGGFRQRLGIFRGGDDCAGLKLVCLLLQARPDLHAMHIKHVDLKANFFPVGFGPLYGLGALGPL